MASLQDELHPVSALSELVGLDLDDNNIEVGAREEAGSLVLQLRQVLHIEEPTGQVQRSKVVIHHVMLV